MSKESANKFREDLKSDLSLKNRLDDLLKKNSDLSETEKKEKIVEFANNEGYNLDISDFDNVSGELNDDELFNVAGGRTVKGDHGCYCFGSNCSAFFT